MEYAEDKRVLQFVNEETEFHLGFLPTEQSNSKTETLSKAILDDTAAGIDMILSVDEDIVPKAQQVLASPVFGKLVDSMSNAIENGGRVFFSGCGATGRLCILLDASWRRFWRGLCRNHPGLAQKVDADELQHRTVSIMTGGERALIRSVENFEDFMRFGRQQMIEKNVSDKDVVVAITEGGETSSVIGTAWQGVDVNADVFFVFNNPADVLVENIERSRDIINHTAVNVLDLASGPMAIAGSTRMQATTSELLVVGAAIDQVIIKLLTQKLSQEELSTLQIKTLTPESYADKFANLLNQLRSPSALSALAGMTEFEEQVYQAKGLVTYFADEYLIDILTDTTERAPTFMLPPFRPADDTTSVKSWAFVKNPLYPTSQAWENLLQRSADGLNWTSELYRQMNAPQNICENPPKLGAKEILKFMVGNEDDSSRYEDADNAVVYVLGGNDLDDQLAQSFPFKKAADKLAEPYAQRVALCVGAKVSQAQDLSVFNVECDLSYSPMDLWGHLALKLALNTVSTATMARMERVLGNWMVYVETSNKKLIDRATRLIQRFTDLDYLSACAALHETLDIIKEQNGNGKAPIPAAVMTIDRVNEPKSLKV